MPDAAWNGAFEGKDMPAGVYVYVAVVRKEAGAEQLQGDVLLVR